MIWCISLKNNLGEYDPKIKKFEVIYGPNRIGDIPSLNGEYRKSKKVIRLPTTVFITKRINGSCQVVLGECIGC
jgi:hypothetical protein